jgi:hypothetical protein
VDERNQVKDSQWLGTPLYGTHHKFYRDPDALWKRIEKTVLGYYRRMVQAGRKPA